jgi:glycosyltransferase involved in cell wall biosynthesis
VTREVTAAVRRLERSCWFDSDQYLLGVTHPRRLSIAMCTYNGARYLEQQLQRIAIQTRPADQLVVCDDGSDDGSADIIRRFAGEVACPVRLRSNEKRLGWTKNFEQAIGLCEGEIIVLADQDDLWHPTKLARREAVFVSCPRVGAVISDAEIVDENLHPMGYRLWDSLNFSPYERRQAARGMFVEVLLKRNVATGATLAFGAELREQVLPIPSEWVHDAHDAWITLLIAAVADFV